MGIDARPHKRVMWRMRCHEVGRRAAQLDQLIQQIRPFGDLVRVLEKLQHLLELVSQFVCNRNRVSECTLPGQASMQGLSHDTTDFFFI